MSCNFDKTRAGISVCVIFCKKHGDDRISILESSIILIQREGLSGPQS